MAQGRAHRDLNTGCGHTMRKGRPTTSRAASMADGMERAVPSIDHDPAIVDHARRASMGAAGRIAFCGFNGWMDLSTWAVTRHRSQR